MHARQMRCGMPAQSPQWNSSCRTVLIAASSCWEPAAWPCSRGLEAPDGCGLLPGSRPIPFCWASRQATRCRMVSSSGPVWRPCRWKSTRECRCSPFRCDGRWRKTGRSRRWCARAKPSRVPSWGTACMWKSRDCARSVPTGTGSMSKANHRVLQVACVPRLPPATCRSASASVWPDASITRQGCSPPIATSARNRILMPCSTTATTSTRVGERKRRCPCVMERVG
jgi:hypothetical protein